jgi:hypothetical protein
MPLHGDEAGRELATEQLAVEMVVGGVKAGIGAVRRVGVHRLASFGICIVRYILWWWSSVIFGFSSRHETIFKQAGLLIATGCRSLGGRAAVIVQHAE